MDALCRQTMREDGVENMSKNELVQYVYQLNMIILSATSRAQMLHELSGMEPVPKKRTPVVVQYVGFES